MKTKYRMINVLITKNVLSVVTAFLLCGGSLLGISVSANELNKPGTKGTGNFIDAADFGFLPTETGVNNAKALQTAIEKGGTINITKTGTYKIAATVFIGDNTTIIFGNGVFIEKSDEKGKYTHVFLNRGALTRTYNHNISIIGLDLKVNGVDKPWSEIYGLRGHVAFFYVRNLNVERFRCAGLVNGQFALHICTFEDIAITDSYFNGKKDGIHLGKGKRFRISNCVFETGDDAIALAAGDWVTANPEFGNIENGIIENCYDLKTDRWDGGFAKIVASGWTDWKSGMEVRHGDAVVSNGKIFRVVAEIDGKSFKSTSQPDFNEGFQVLDGIKWTFHGNDTIHTAVVKNVTFRDIFLESDRVPFQLMCYGNNWAHSYYKGAPMPTHSGIILENVTVINEKKKPFATISSPCDVLTIRNSSFKENGIVFNHAVDFDVYPKTIVNLINCTFNASGNFTVVKNNSKGKVVLFKTSGSLEAGTRFSAAVDQGPGRIVFDSDLTGLKTMGDGGK